MSVENDGLLRANGAGNGPFNVNVTFRGRPLVWTDWKGKRVEVVEGLFAARTKSLTSLVARLAENLLGLRIARESREDLVDVQVLSVEAIEGMFQAGEIAERLAVEMSSSIATPTRNGNPPPPYSGDALIAPQPASTYWRYASTKPGGVVTVWSALCTLPT